jgi:hypothetical protein
VVGALFESRAGDDQVGLDPLQPCHNDAQLGAKGLERADVFAVAMCADDVDGRHAQIGAGLTSREWLCQSSSTERFGELGVAFNGTRFAVAGRISRA